MYLNMLELEEIIRRALVEDIGSGDITTALTVPADSVSRAQIVAKQDGVIAGLEVVSATFAIALCLYPQAEEGLEIVFLVADGDRVTARDVVAEITGPTPVLLTAERTALNFLQRMSGIATETARLSDLIKHTKAKVVDTRKTVPGLRMLDKCAVRIGGGQNHRFGLYDAILIKDNHIRAAGGVGQAVAAAKSAAPHTIKIEVETETLEQIEEVLDAGADMILLDNMDVPTLKQAVALCKGRAITEASGGVTADTIVKIAETGVDLISVGALTHSVKALDLSLEIVS